MVNEATIEAYKAMAKDSECPSMETQIRENLERTCDKFAGNEDKFERCISYLEECASEILEGKNGDVPDVVCFRICRDYFNDEIWKAEDEENERKNAEEERLAKEKAEKEKKAPAKSAKTKKKAPAKPTNPAPEPEPENKATDEPPKKEHTTEAVPAMDADGQYCLF